MGRVLNPGMAIAIFGAALALSAPISAQDHVARLPPPEAVVGGLEARGGVEFQWPRDGAILPGGGFVICESIQGHFRVLFFDAAGVLVKETGRWGDGPFERSVPVTLCDLDADGSVLVSGPDGRWARFDKDGEGVDEGRWRGFPVPLYPTAVYRDSVFGVQATADGTLAGVVYGEGASRRATVLHFLPSPEFEPGDRIIEPPFQEQPTVAVGGGMIWSFNPRDGVLKVETPAWSAEHQVPWGRRQVTSEDREAWRSRNRDAGGRFDFPDRMPAFQRVDVDDKGRAWVLRFEPSPTDARYEWSIVDPRTGTVGRLSAATSYLDPSVRWMSESLPAAILDIGFGKILLLTKDAMDVPVVSLHDLPDWLD